jgi:hypothetical protein
MSTNRSSNDPVCLATMVQGVPAWVEGPGLSAVVLPGHRSDPWWAFYAMVQESRFARRASMVAKRGGQRPLENSDAMEKGSRRSEADGSTFEWSMGKSGLIG